MSRYVRFLSCKWELPVRIKADAILTVLCTVRRRLVDIRLLASVSELEFISHLPTIYHIYYIILL